VISLLSVFALQTLVAGSVPACPAKLIPTTTEGYFKGFYTAQYDSCKALCKNCTGSVKLLSSLVRCLDINATTTVELSDFSDSGICINISAGVVVKNDIKFEKGDNCVIIGSGAVVGNVLGGSGNDFVYAEHYANVGNVDLRGGNDILTTGYGATVNGVDLGSGRDFLYPGVKNQPRAILGKVKLGKGRDFVNATSADFTSIDAGSGKDIVYLYESVVQKTLNLGDSDDFVQFVGSNVTKVDGGRGDNVFAYSATKPSVIGDLEDDSSDIICTV